MSDAPLPRLAEHVAGQIPNGSVEHEPYGIGQVPGRPLVTTDAIAKLAMATQVLLIVCGVMSVATIGIETFGISAVTGFLAGDNGAIGMLDVYDQSTFVVSILSSLSLITAGVRAATAGVAGAGLPAPAARALTGLIGSAVSRQS